MLTLDKIPLGLAVRIVGFHHASPVFRQKLLAMGATPGVIVKIVQVAPLGDPIQVLLRGYLLSLRKKDCNQIEVEYVYDTAEQYVATS